jgi:lipopolysaccharide export system protein LptA
VSERLSAILFLFVCAAFYPAKARAVTEIRGDSVTIGDCGEYITFSFLGNVAAVGEEFELFSDRMDVISVKRDDFLKFGNLGASVKELHAFGNVKFAQPNRNGSADEILLNATNETAILLGNATVTDSSGMVRGDRLFLNRESSTAKVESSGRSVVLINDRDHVDLRDPEPRKFKSRGRGQTSEENKSDE